jgi:steroid delta-isomerase-like uncharacterized protein
VEKPTTERLIDQVMSDLFNTGRLTVIDQVGADNLCVYYPQADTPLCGREAVKHAFSRARAAFPDAYFLIEETVTSYDRVVVRWTGRATHTGSFWGMPATGCQVTWAGAIFFHLGAGQIVEAWVFADALRLRQQLEASQALRRDA